MPVYEYECSACGHQFEEWQKISDEPIKTCPKCKKKKVQKLISQTAFHLKGGGWYKDLYSSTSGSKKDSDSGGSDSSSSSKSESKAETKSESKSESKPAKSDTAKPAKSAKAGK